MIHLYMIFKSKRTACIYYMNLPLVYLTSHVLSSHIWPSNNRKANSSCVYDNLHENENNLFVREHIHLSKLRDIFSSAVCKMLILSFIFFLRDAVMVYLSCLALICTLNIWQLYIFWNHISQILMKLR